MKKIALLMLVFTLFASTNVCAQKLENGTYEVRVSGFYGDSGYMNRGTIVTVSVTDREIKSISFKDAAYNYQNFYPNFSDDKWMKNLINGDGSDYSFYKDKRNLKNKQEYEENLALLKKEGPRYTSVQDFADAIVKNQSTVIDVMSGATQTCEAVIEAVHYALCKGKTTGWSTESKKNSEIVSAWEQEGKQKRLATAQRREKLKEEERQRIAQAEAAEAERNRLEEEARQEAEEAEQKAEAERLKLEEEARQQRIAEALKQTPVTPAASDFKHDSADGTYGGVKIIKYLGNATAIKIPEKIEGLPVTEIGSEAFDNNTLVKIVIPGTIKEMNEAFGKCIELREVVIEDGMEVLYSFAFLYCKNLKSIKLPAGLKAIGIGAFSQSGLESVIIPDSVTVIYDLAFVGCENLKSVTLSKNLEVIYPGAFNGCSSLSEIVIPDTLKVSFANMYLNTTFYRNYGYVIGTFEGCSSLPLATKSKLRELGYSGEF